MRFLRTFRADFRRMALSGKFYTAILAVAGIAFLSVWPEAQAGGQYTSIYYLVKARGGISAFLLANSVLIVLPYALGGREDLQNNYIHGMESRSGLWNYSLSKTLTASTGAFLAVFLGYSLCFGLMSLNIPVIRPEELEAISRNLAAGGIDYYDTLILSGQSILYCAAEFATEALGYAFMAGFALMMSAKISNVYILLSMPVLLYYGSIFVSNLLWLPGIFCWYYIMSHGGWLFQVVSGIGALMLCVFLYFGSLIFLEGVVYYFWMKRRKTHG